MSQTNSNTNNRKAILIRAILVFSGMFFFGLAVVYFVFKIQVKEGQKWRTKAENLSTHVFDVAPVRGNIFDCNGNLLASSVPIYDVRIDGLAKGFVNNDNFDADLDSLSICMANEFQDRSAKSYKSLFTKVKKAKNRYFLLKRKISFRQMQRMSKFPIFRMGKYKGGLLITERTTREKPFEMLAERTIGFTQTGVAKVGLEGSFDFLLKGKSGKQVMQRIAGGTWIPIDDENSIEAQEGKDVYTTIDVNLQDVATHSLMNKLIEERAEWGTAILMEVSTGHIKAIVNLNREKDGSYVERYNYAIGSKIEPGSTMKLISMLSLIEDGFVTSKDKVDAENGLKTFCNYTMHDSHTGTGIITMQEAFEHSSNVAIAKQIVRFYQKNPEQFYQKIQSLNLTSKLKLQIAGEVTPSVLNPNNPMWSCSSLPSMSIGYGLSFTPLQLLSVYNAIANNGKLVKPIFVSQVSDAGQTVKQYKPNVLVEKVCSDATLKQLREMMEGVVVRGTAAGFKSEFYSYAGKTGTAVIANDGKGYNNAGKKFYRASFCGYFPADAPKYSCCIVVSKPLKEYYAAKVALPVFKDIADKVYATSIQLHTDLRNKVAIDSMAHLPPISKIFTKDLKQILMDIDSKKLIQKDSVEEDGDWSETEKNGINLAYQSISFENELVPNVLGMGIRDALYLLESKGVQVQVLGSGKVKKQSVSPNTPIKQVKKIVLQLSKA